jgi:hypothetical protein
LATTRHDCRWRREADALRKEAAENREQLTSQAQQLAAQTEQLKAVLARVDQMEHKLALATKQIIGPKSERMPTPEQEAKKREGHEPSRGGYTNPKKRKENAEALASLPTTIVPHPVPDEQRRWLTALGAGGSLRGDGALAGGARDDRHPASLPTFRAGVP